MLMQRPITKHELIEKEVALICLNWAQAKLDEQVPIFSRSTLTKIRETILTKINPHNNKIMRTYKFVLELLFDPSERPGRSIRKGSFLTFMSKIPTNKIPEIPPVSKVELNGPLI
jgi:hypothetical protein